MNYSNKLHINYFIILIIALSISTFYSCSEDNDNEIEEEAGLSLGIASIPNLRDMGVYKTTNGETIKKGLLYRSNQLNNISASDMLLFANLNIKNDYDLRTADERNEKPDELPDNVNNVWLNILADDTSSGPANLINLLRDPIKANTELGNGEVERLFAIAYRQFISLESAKDGFSELFKALGDEEKLPALFHCTTGKDRTGWAAAAFLTLMGVPKDDVVEDYLRSNEYILPMYESLMVRFEEAGGNPSIPRAILGVKIEYLNAAFDEMENKYENIERYFSECLGISPEEQAAMRSLYLKK